MAEIQKQFEEFHENIKLRRFGENAILREKRDIVVKKIKEGIKKQFEDDENGVPVIKFIDQGSYAVDLGIIPEDGDYDIDEGIIFDLNIEDYEDPIEMKKWIRDIMDGHTSVPAKIQKPCVTIIYSQNDEPIYHVDMPVYAKSRYDDSLFIAWGKEYSSDDKKYWEKADPEGLNEYIMNGFTGEDQKQFKRIVRYMKKWKDIRFQNTGNSRPPSIGITIAAVELFVSYSEYNQISGKTEQVDLKALRNFVYGLKGKFTRQWDNENNEYVHTIDYRLPIEPYTNVFCKMTIKQMNDFYGELEELYDVLGKAETDKDPHTACTLISEYFGDKFPVPEAKETRYVVGLSSAPASHSALG